MNKTIKETAEYMIVDYLIDDPSITKIYWSPHDKHVRLVVVSGTFIQDEYDEYIYPLGFAPNPPDVMYGQVITRLSQKELDKALDGKMKCVPDFFSNLELLYKKKTIKKLAISYANSYIEQSGIEKVYWAPDNKKIILVMIDSELSNIQNSNCLKPIEFNPSASFRNFLYDSLISSVNQNDFDKAINGEFDSVPEFFKRLELIAEK